MSFLGEIKRRKVFQVAAAYLVVAWLIMQVVDVVDDPLRVPDWFATVVLLLLAVGFPIALIASWAFDVTPAGVVRDPMDVARGDSRTIEYVLIGVLGCAVIWLLYRDVSSPGVATLPAAALSDTSGAEPAVELLPNGIAILPFDNMSVDPDDGFFAAGIHDEIISQVANIKDLNVIARTSVMQYEGARQPITEIARELGVPYVLEGSVSYAGERVRLRAQLIDGASGTHLWSEAFQGSVADVFAIYADISARIADSLQAELLPSERARIARVPTTSQAAYALYLASLQNGDRALELLDRAMENDEGFALAHAQKANILGFDFVNEVARAASDASRDAEAVAEELERTVIYHAQRALELDPTLGRAQAALGRMHMRYWRRAQTEEAFARAYELSPKDPDVLRQYSLISSWTGEHDRAIEFSEQAAALDPEQGIIDVSGNLSVPYFWAGDYDAAARLIEDALIAAPNRPFLYFYLAETEAARDDYSAAVGNLRIFEQLIGGWAQGSIARAAYVYSLAGRPDDVRRVLALVEERPTPPSQIQLALGQLALGNHEAALRLFRDSLENPLPLPGATITILVKNNVFDDPVLEQPEFVEVRDRLGFH
ncbi:MAG TPA: hypothetical protein VLD39_18245, partial [Gammaproteobacteria bacterium]|nr:hypothetical protein [Gammaproteobacteria bacterium]